MPSLSRPSPRVDDPAAPLPGRGWTHVGWWLLALNAAIPIRLLGGIPYPAGIERSVGLLLLEHTAWALTTYLTFRLALRARREPVRRVVTLLAALALPLLVLQFYGTAVAGQLLGLRGRPMARALLINGPFNLFLIVAAAALGLLVVYMRRERDHAVLQATLREELASARLETLRLQLNPHFLFNALNAIASLVVTDAAKADAAIAALSSFLRASLSRSGGEEATLEDELRLVDAYLEIEVLRFEWLTVDLEVPDALRSACVPAFVLQLLVENAIRHGLAPRRTPGSVTIAARLDGDRLELCVRDDGVGLGAPSRDASLGIGLANVRARLAQLHGPDGTLTLAPAVPQGTVATLRIPYRACPAAARPSPVPA